MDVRLRSPGFFPAPLGTGYAAGGPGWAASFCLPGGALPLGRHRCLSGCALATLIESHCRWLPGLSLSLDSGFAGRAVLTRIKHHEPKV